jgi:hypothetical protein
MKGRELLETYPKIAKIIKEWFTTKMIESMSDKDDIPQDFKDHMMARGADEELLVNIIDKNPAALFEVFDSLHVYIGIVIDQLPETEQVVFNYYICPKGKCLDTSPQEFLNRKDVDHYAMLAAVEYINNNIDEL